MNIFYINEDPIIAARELADDHIRKMQIESAQMLCTTFRHFGYEAPYKKAHYNHPSTIWVRQSMQHFDWLLNHGIEICDQFSLRYQKSHATLAVLEWCKDNKFLLTHKLLDNGFTPPPLCMPDIYKCKDAIKSYQNFYIYDKVAIKGLSWSKLGNKPDWVS